MTIIIDNEHTTSLKEFIKDNTAPDVHAITTEDIEIIKALKIEEHCYVGMCEIKRLA